MCQRHTLSHEQLSTWKRQLLENAAIVFEPAKKLSPEDQERIAHLEQRLGRVTLKLEIQKKLDFLEGTPDKKREIVKMLETDSSVRRICETLGFNRSLFFYRSQYEFF